MPNMKLDHRDRLNRSMPAAKAAGLGDMLDALAKNHNALLDALKAGTTVDDALIAKLRVKPLAER